MPAQPTIACAAAIECPNCGRLTTGGLFGHSNEPKHEHELAWTVTHCGCYHEPRGGERYTAAKDHEDERATSRAPRLTDATPSVAANGWPAVMTGHPHGKGISSITGLQVGPRSPGPIA